MVLVDTKCSLWQFTIMTFDVNVNEMEKCLEGINPVCTGDRLHKGVNDFNWSAEFLGLSFSFAGVHGIFYYVCVHLYIFPQQTSIILFMCCKHFKWHWIFRGHVFYADHIQHFLKICEWNYSFVWRGFERSYIFHCVDSLITFWLLLLLDLSINILLLLLLTAEGLLPSIVTKTVRFRRSVASYSCAHSGWMGLDSSRVMLDQLGTQQGTQVIRQTPWEMVDMSPVLWCFWWMVRIFF